MALVSIPLQTAGYMSTSPSTIFSDPTDGYEEDIVRTASSSSSTRVMDVVQPQPLTVKDSYQWIEPQNAATTLYTRRQMQQEKRASAMVENSSSGGPAPYRSPSPSLRINTSPTLSSGRPTFHRRGSSLSSSTTTASSSSEAVTTPTISPYSSAYTFTPNTSSTMNTGISTFSSSACSTGGIPKSPFSHFDLLPSRSAASSSSRPPLFRSASEDVHVYHRSAPLLSASSGGASVGGLTKDVHSLPMQGRALTTSTVYGRQLSNLQGFQRKGMDGQEQRRRRSSAGLISHAVSLPGTVEEVGVEGGQTLGEGTSTALPPLATLPDRSPLYPAQQELQGPGQIEATTALTPHSSDFSCQRPTATEGIPLSRLAASAPIRPTASLPFQAQSSTSSTSTPRRRDLESPSSIFLASFDPATAEAIRRAAASVRATTRDEGATGSMSGALKDSGVNGCLGPQSGLMGNCGNGFFGDAIRAKVANIIQGLLPECASVTRDENISIVEYGSLNSLSASLVKPITTQITTLRHSASQSISSSRPSFNVLHTDIPGSDFRALMRQLDNPSSDSGYQHFSPDIFSSFATKNFAAQVVPPRSVDLGYSLMDLHCRRTAPSSGLSAVAAAQKELQSFLQTRAIEFKQGGLLVLAFLQRSEDDDICSALSAAKTCRLPEEEEMEAPGFTSPLRATRALPHNMGTHSTAPSSASNYSPNSFSSHSSPATSSVTSSPETSAPSPCQAMLRSRSGSSPCIPSYKHDSNKKNDIWSSIPALLAPCIQRLVSTGLIKSDTAHHLLALPVHPRTPKQTQAALRSVRDQWQLEWSCGLPEQTQDRDSSPSTPTSSGTNATRPISNDTPAATAQASSHIQEEALHLDHPAYTAFQSSTLSRVQFAEHALQFIRVLYEAHFRNVLRDHARLSRSRLEEVLDALNEVLREKIEENGRPLLALEIECCIVALRKL